jgi:hypothetical protein
MGYNRAPSFLASDNFAHTKIIGRVAQRFAEGHHLKCEAHPNRPIWTFTERAFQSGIRKKFELSVQPVLSDSFVLLLTPTVEVKISPSLVRSPAFPRTKEVELARFVTGTNGSSRISSKKLQDFLDEEWKRAKPMGPVGIGPTIERVLGDR